MRFSIITVVRNMENEIEATLRSTIEQTYADNEIIVIDGASTDDTVAKARRLLRPQDILVSEPDAGIYDAMNKGIALATGTVVNFMNAGDSFASPNVLQAIYKRWDPKHPVVHGIVDFLHPNKVFAVRTGRAFHLSEYRKGRVYCHQGEFICRELFKKFGVYDCQFPVAADFDFRLRLLNAKIFPRFVDVHCATCVTGGVAEQSEKKWFSEHSKVLMRHHGWYWAARHAFVRQIGKWRRALK